MITPRNRKYRNKSIKYNQLDELRRELSLLRSKVENIERNKYGGTNPDALKAPDPAKAPDALNSANAVTANAPDALKAPDPADPANAVTANAPDAVTPAALIAEALKSETLTAEALKAAALTANALAANAAPTANATNAANALTAANADALTANAAANALTAANAVNAPNAANAVNAPNAVEASNGVTPALNPAQAITQERISYVEGVIDRIIKRTALTMQQPPIFIEAPFLLEKMAFELVKVINNYVNAFTNPEFQSKLMNPLVENLPGYINDLIKSRFMYWIQHPKTPVNLQDVLIQLFHQLVPEPKTCPMKGGFSQDDCF